MLTAATHFLLRHKTLQLQGDQQMVLPDQDVQSPQTASDGSPTSESAIQTSSQVVKTGRYYVSMTVVIADVLY
jgi:hypothetical protein